MSAKPRAPREPLPLRGCYDTYFAAEYLSVSRRQMEKFIADGLIHAFHLRGMTQAWFVNIEELDRFRLESAADLQVAS